MTSNRLLHSTRFVEWGIRIDRAPAWWWLAAQAAALWPTWVWSARRMVDGSDDPLGMLALGGLALVAWQTRKELRASRLITEFAQGLREALGPVGAGSFSYGWLADTNRQVRPLPSPRERGDGM